MSAPLISVIMASYNHAQYLPEAVESVWSQTYPNIELVIVDDDSQDESRDLLKSMLARSPIPMRVEFNKQNQGPAVTIGRAFDLSKGELIAFLASDDVYAPSRFERQMRGFAEDPELLVSFADGMELHSGCEVGKRVHGDEVRMLLEKSTAEILTYLYTHVSPLHLQCSLVKRDVLLKAHAFDKSAIADDWLTNIRIFEQLVQTGHCAFVDQVVCYYRVHDGNLHKDIERHIRLVKQMVNVYLPPKFRRVARANSYWDIGLSLALRQPARALYYMFLSQANSLRPLVVLRLFRRILERGWRKTKKVFTHG